MATDAALAPVPFTDTALLAYDAKGQQIVSIHAKRTYRFGSSGTCTLADEQQPLLVPDSKLGPDSPRETDVTPIKTATDLIVIASARAPRPGTREMTTAVAVGDRRWEYAIIGERRCSYRGRGSIAFSDPLPFERIPLRYENAYGGFDKNVAAPPPRTALEAFAMHPGLYPRNPVGRGYVVYENPASVEDLLLPNVEHPGHRLNPRNLVTGGPEWWWRQPVPWSCDWFDKTWYPRVTFFGGLPDHLPDDDREVAEVRGGLLERGQNARHATLKREDCLDSRLANAATPWLAVGSMRGDEAILLEGMTAEARLVVSLPGRPPRMHLRFRGRIYGVVPVLHRVLVSSEEMGVYLVWHGAWPTPQRLPARFPRAGEDARMELEGGEVFTDGRPVDPLV